MKKVTQTKIGMTSHAWEIAHQQADESGCSSISEWLEWVTLSQQYSAAEAAVLLEMRAKRGRVKVHVEAAK